MKASREQHVTLHYSVGIFTASTICCGYLVSSQSRTGTNQAEASSAKQAADAATAAETAAREKASELSARLQEARSRLVTGTDEADGDSGGGDSSVSSQLAEVGTLQMELQVLRLLSIVICENEGV